MGYYIVQKKSRPYVNGGFWCVDIIVSSSETGVLYKDLVYGKRIELEQIKKGDTYIPKYNKELEKLT